MRVIFNEMKKIWNPKGVLVTIILSIIIYILFMEYNVNYFGAGHPKTEFYNFGIEMTNKYGPTLELDEFNEFINEKKDELNEEFQKVIQIEKLLLESDIITYSKLIEFSNLRSVEGAQLDLFDGDEEKLKEINTAKWRIYGEEHNYLGFKLDAIYLIEERYLANTQAVDISIYSLMMSNYIKPYFLYSGIVITLSVLILISPLITNDKLNSVKELQYSTRKGRKLLLSQLIAALISTTVLVIVFVAIFGILFSKTGTQVFWNNGFNSFNSSEQSVFIFTYGQWVISNVVFIFIFSIALTFILMMISKISSNLISLLFKLIPILVVIIIVFGTGFYSMLLTSNLLYRITNFKGTEFIVLSLIMLVAVKLFFNMNKKNMTTDLI